MVKQSAHNRRVASATPAGLTTISLLDVHKRMRLPEDIAEAAVFLALQTPETMTGQLLSAPDFDQEHGINRLSAFNRLKS